MMSSITANQYFDALRELLNARIIDSPTAKGGHYRIQELEQPAFLISTENISHHLVMTLEKGKRWLCFKDNHSYAHKKCDRVVVTWSKKHNAPVYLLCELKSNDSSGAWTQIQSSMAFCHFVHGLLEVNKSNFPKAIWVAVIIKYIPIQMKITSTSLFQHGGKSHLGWIVNTCFFHVNQTLYL